MSPREAGRALRVLASLGFSSALDAACSAQKVGAPCGSLYSDTCATLVRPGGPPGRARRMPLADKSLQISRFLLLG